MSKRLGIDIDGVLRNLYPYLLDMLKKYNPQLTIPSITELTDYEIWKNIPGITEMALKEFWFNGTHSRPIYLYSPLYEGVTKGLRLIKNLDWNIILISDQPNIDRARNTLEWIKQHNLPYHEIHIMCNQKEMVDCDAYVEDSPFQINNLAQKGKRVFVMNRPWNRYMTMERLAISRVKNMEDIYNHLEKHREKT